MLPSLVFARSHLRVKFGDLLLLHVRLLVNSALVPELQRQKGFLTFLTINLLLIGLASRFEAESATRGRLFFSYNLDYYLAHLQSWDAFADWLRILSQQALFIQELAVPPIARRLEEPVVEDVFQALVEGAQDPLLGDPHGRVGVEAHAFLVAETCERQDGNWSKTKVARS